MSKDVAITDAFDPGPEAASCALPQGRIGASGAPSGSDGTWDLVRILRTTLRGRYRLTILLAMLACGIGAAAGWLWAGPLYRSDGMVRISSVLPSANPQNENQPIPMFESFMESQQGLIISRSLLEKALREPIWDEKGVGDKRPSVSALAANLKVEVRGRSENLRIGYTDPVASVASAAVESIIAAYHSVFVQANQNLDQERLRSLEDYQKTLPRQLEQAKNAEPPVALAPTSADFQMPSAAQVAQVDPTMARLIDRREDAKDNLNQASEEFGPNHPTVLRLGKAYEIAADRVDQYLSQYVAFHPITEDDSTIPQTPSGQSTGPPLSVSMQQAQAELERVGRQIELLKAQSAMPKQFEIVDAGDLPISEPARQIKCTILGGGLAGGLVLSFMVLLGSRNRRYLFCRDVVENMGPKLRFHAAVPDLNAAGKTRHSLHAAQSIHYLRNKLEQNGSVFMVTSADWGEGRTSVAMSLALSVCSAGARILVIDADLETRGLTCELGMEDHPGLVDLLRDGNAPPLRKIPDKSIAILPAGAASVTAGLSISSAAVGRLLKRLKAEFDVVLIDAGPVLGRVETCVMARQVDGVLLTICRGQQQALWDKALQELDAVDAAYGAIFNCAKPDDFEDFVRPRAPTRSHAQGRQIAEKLSKFGPLVEAVAGSLTHDVEFFPIFDGVKIGSKKAA